MKRRHITALLLAAALTLSLTACGKRISARSYVEKRLSHDKQRRRRRTMSPSSLIRVSATVVSAAPQNGHFIQTTPLHRKDAKNAKGRKVLPEDTLVAQHCQRLHQPKN